MLYILISIINKYSTTLQYVNSEYSYRYEYKSEDPYWLDGLYILDTKTCAYNWRYNGLMTPYIYNISKTHILRVRDSNLSKNY